MKAVIVALVSFLVFIYGGVYLVLRWHLVAFAVAPLAIVVYALGLVIWLERVRRSQDQMEQEQDQTEQEQELKRLRRRLSMFESSEGFPSEKHWQVYMMRKAGFTIQAIAVAMGWNSTTSVDDKIRDLRNENLLPPA